MENLADGGAAAALDHERENEATGSGFGRSSPWRLEINRGHRRETTTSSQAVPMEMHEIAVVSGGEAELISHVVAVGRPIHRR